MGVVRAVLFLTSDRRYRIALRRPGGRPEGAARGFACRGSIIESNPACLYRSENYSTLSPWLDRPYSALLRRGICNKSLIVQNTLTGWQESFAPGAGSWKGERRTAIAPATGQPDTISWRACPQQQTSDLDYPGETGSGSVPDCYRCSALATQTTGCSPLA